jgi:dihydropyrimidine dehydrogenase (NAD+) subunit PreA
MDKLRYRDIELIEEAGSCLLCDKAPCSKACPYGLKPDKVIRSVRFENLSGAAGRLPSSLPCSDCESKACKSSCLKGRISRPVNIDRVMAAAASAERVINKEPDLSIDFCGVRCENPFFLSSSVVSSSYEMVAKAFEMGWAGAAFKTIGMFVPKDVSPRFSVLKKESLPFVGFKNIEQISDHTLEENIAFIKRLKADYPSKIIIASIMGRSEKEWTTLAELMTEAGADILECNFSCPHMAADGLGSDVGQNPILVADYTSAVRKGSRLPILAKMTPNLGDMISPALAAVNAGADGIAAINTIKSVMNIDLASFASAPDVLGRSSVGGYSGKAVKPIALYFIQALKNSCQLKNIPISGMGGIESWKDAAEFIALGCENIQVTTAVMQYGYRIIEDMLEGMKLYLSQSGCNSITEIVGRALPKLINNDDLNRDSICYPKFDKALCVGCGRCIVSCFDGGHQALVRDEKSGKPLMDGSKCVGCHLCLHVCPAKAIAPGKRASKKSSIVYKEVSLKQVQAENNSIYPP